jgi:hypothetical protein
MSDTIGKHVKQYTKRNFNTTSDKAATDGYLACHYRAVKTSGQTHGQLHLCSK